MVRPGTRRADHHQLERDLADGDGAPHAGHRVDPRRGAPHLARRVHRVGQRAVRHRRRLLDVRLLPARRGAADPEQRPTGCPTRPSGSCARRRTTRGRRSSTTWASSRRSGSCPAATATSTYPLPTFMWCNFTLTDAAMHEGGPHSEIAAASVRDSDARLGEVLAAVEQRGCVRRHRVRARRRPRHGGDRPGVHRRLGRRAPRRRPRRSATRATASSTSESDARSTWQPPSSSSSSTAGIARVRRRRRRSIIGFALDRRESASTTRRFLRHRPTRRRGDLADLLERQKDAVIKVTYERGDDDVHDRPGPREARSITSGNSKVDRHRRRHDRLRATSTRQPTCLDVPEGVEQPRERRALVLQRHRAGPRGLRPTSCPALETTTGRGRGPARRPAPTRDSNAFLARARPTASADSSSRRRARASASTTRRGYLLEFSTDRGRDQRPDRDRRRPSRRPPTSSRPCPSGIRCRARSPTTSTAD